jgi:hypothetical protein
VRTARDQRIAPAAKRTRKFQLERDRSRANAVGPQPPRDRVAMRDQHAPQLDRVEREVMRESIFLAVRLALPVGDHRPRIVARRKFPQMRSHRAEHALQLDRVAPREIADRLDSAIMHPRECHAAYAPQPLDRQRR